MLRPIADRAETHGNSVPNHWDFKVFHNHFEIDQTYLRIVEDEANRPDNNLRAAEGTGIPDSVLLSIGQALLVPVIAAREAGPV